VTECRVGDDGETLARVGSWLVERHVDGRGRCEVGRNVCLTKECGRWSDCEIMDLGEGGPRSRYFIQTIAMEPGKSVRDQEAEGQVWGRGSGRSWGSKAK
jgi:hypothetical protein